MLFLYVLTWLAAPVLSFAPPSRTLRGGKPQLMKRGRLQNDPTRRSTSSGAQPHVAPRQASSSGACASGNQITTTAPKSNIFAGLTDDEAAAVTSFLHAQDSLNLTAAATASGWDNYILIVELLQPNKSDALTYLDSNGTAPARYARAVIQVGATLEPHIQEYQVGPLPVTNGTTTVSPLNYIYNKGSGSQLLYANADAAAGIAFTYQVSTSVADITQKLLNGTALGAPNDTLAIASSNPLLFEDDKTFTWNQFFSINTTPCLDEYLLMSSLQFKADVTGRDPTKWSVVAWQFNGIFYNSEAAFRQAINSSDFIIPGANVDGDWACTDYNNEPFPHDELNPPVPVQPEGSRFAVDEQEKYVEWMDFTFYLSSTRDRGLQLHDITYKGERIIYEVGLQEAVAHYASSSDPFQAHNAYLDSFYGFGVSTFQLVSGYDCPSYATYLNTSFYTGETTHVHPSSICLFEFDTAYPIQRHTAPSYVSNTKNIRFTVRTVATVGNYDYLFDYHFFYDGSIHIEVRASGYIQSSFYTTNFPSSDGFHIHDHVAGSMHDHVLNYKLDMDVAGTENSFIKTSLVPTSQVYPWSNGKVRNSMTIEKEFLASEDDGSLNWDVNNAVMYSVVNKDEPNAFGEYKSYKIMPGSYNHNYLVVENSSVLSNSVHWADHHLYVAQRKDTEPHSASPYNTYDPSAPLVDFAKFLDGESLDQEDLVVWFNLGMHHIPDASDIPNTVFTNAFSSMIIAPQNYLTGDPSRSTIHQTRINAINGSVTDALTFGAKPATGSVDLSCTAPNLQSFIGEVYFPKYPYHPDMQEIGNIGTGAAGNGGGAGGMGG